MFNVTGSDNRDIAWENDGVHIQFCWCEGPRLYVHLTTVGRHVVHDDLFSNWSII